jgi:hypothetical protein
VRGGLGALVAIFAIACAPSAAPAKVVGDDWLDRIEGPAAPAAASAEDIAAYREAIGECDASLSPIARATPPIHRDDPVRHVGLERQYEEILGAMDAGDPDRPRLLDRIASRYVAIEQWAHRDLLRACMQPLPRTHVDVARLTAELRSAVAEMQYARVGASQACARLEAAHPSYRSQAGCEVR